MFCSTRNSNPFHPTVGLVLTFLTELFEEGLGYSAINTARSAISTVMHYDQERSIGTHPKVTRFMKGVFEMRTPLPRYKATWDVSVLLEHFKRKEHNSKLSLKELTKKLCALLLITTAQRVQTIHFVKLSCLQFHETGCTIQVVDKLKHTRPGHHQQALELHKYTDLKLCVVNCLLEYIKRTTELRKNNDQLLLCYVRPFGPASKDTVSRWLKDVLADADICKFTSHSFRGASASAMLNSGFSIDDILKSAGWSNAKTFFKFYKRPVENEQQTRRGEKNSLLNYFAYKKN